MSEKSSPVIIILALLVPIYVGRVQEMIPQLEDLLLAKVGIGIALLMVLSSRKQLQRDNAGLMKVIQMRYLAALFLFSLLSVPFSNWPGGSLNFIVSGYLKILVFTLLLVFCINSEKELRTICVSLSVTAGLIDFFSLVTPKLVENGRVFVGGTYDPNDIALVLVIALPTMFYLMENSRGWRALLLKAAMVLTVIVILKTGSRGGFLALAAVVALTCRQKGSAYLSRRAPLLLIVLLLVISCVPAAQYDRIKTLGAVEDDYNTTDRGGRIEIWKKGISIIAEQPLFGCGISEFSDANGKSCGGTWHTAHNSLLQIGAEQGIPAGVVFILMVVSCAKSLRAGETILKNGWMVAGIRTGLLGFCVGGFFLSWAYCQATYFLFALSITVEKISVKARTARA